VADMGDNTADHPVVIQEYDPSRGTDGPMDPIRTIHDPSWVKINGLTGDLNGNIYVACQATVVVNQPPQPVYNDIQTAIYRYRPPDYNPARRDTVADQGNGIGYVLGTHQIVWNNGYLYIADTDKGWGQKLDANLHNIGYLKVDGTEDGAPGSITSPLGAAADNLDLGHFYISDTGNRRVLRYNLDGTFDQVANQVDTLTGADNLVAPGSICTGSKLGTLYLWVADPGANLINVYKFQR